MKRHEWTKILLWSIVGGFACNAALAQWLGYRGATISTPTTLIWLKLGDYSPETTKRREWGRVTYGWRALPLVDAAIWQAIRNKVPFDQSKREPNYDSPDAVPSWCRVWRQDEVENHWKLTIERTRAGKLGTDHPKSIGLGWPFISFSVDIEHRDTPPPTFTAPFVTHGGIAIEKSLRDFERVLAWRPVMPGIFFSSLAWALPCGAIGFVYVKTRDAIRRRRTRYNICTKCGYDLSQTSIAKPCPECGTLMER